MLPVRVWWCIALSSASTTPVVKIISEAASVIQAKSSLGIVSSITDNFHGCRCIIDPKLRFDHARTANVWTAHRDANAIVSASDAAREAKGRFDLHLLPPSTAAEGHARVAASSIIPNVVKMYVVKVQDGHIVHNRQLGAGLAAARTLGRLHAGIIPLDTILPHDDTVGRLKDREMQ